jgi:ABC-type transport system involved in multi-copper enzyme maturation permease subunit
MTRLFLAELLKLRTIRAMWGFGLAAIAFGGLLAAGTIGSPPNDDRFAPDFQFDLVLSGAFPAVLLALLLGMLLFTNEFRHGTIARTLLASPRRPVLVVLKLMVGAAAGVGLALLAIATTAVVSIIWLGILDVPLEIGDALDGSWRSLLGVALIGALGAAVGGVVHSQVGALVGTLVWLFVAEPIVWVLLGLLDEYANVGGVADYLPGATVLSILDTEGENLSYAGTVGMAAVWIAVATVLAVLRTRRKDIT